MQGAFLCFWDELMDELIKGFLFNQTFLGIPFCEHHLRDTRNTFLQKVSVIVNLGCIVM